MSKPFSPNNWIRVRYMDPIDRVSLSILLSYLSIHLFLLHTHNQSHSKKEGLLSYLTWPDITQAQGHSGEREMEKNDSHQITDAPWSGLQRVPTSPNLDEGCQKLRGRKRAKEGEGEEDSRVSPLGWLTVACLVQTGWGVCACVFVRLSVCVEEQMRFWGSGQQPGK